MKKKVSWLPLKQHCPECYNLLINLIKTQAKNREAIKSFIEDDFMFQRQKTIYFYLHVYREIYLRLTKLGTGATLDIYVRHTEEKG